jgi:sugar/nucleoside kinase (ribokinase family)
MCDKIKHMLFKKRLDFVGMGDVVTDTFIELIDAWIEDDNPEKNKELCMHFGSKIPYKSEVVVGATGNAPNAAHTAMKLGLKTGVITNVGDDEAGQGIIGALKKNGINTKNVTTHKGHDSNHNYVLRYKEERTILVHHNEYDYKLPDFPRGKGPRWIYLSSLAHNSLPHHLEIVEFLKKHPETKLAFQPGTFQIKLGYKKLYELYEQTDLFFCNKEEAQKILQINVDGASNEKTSDDEMKKLLRELFERGPKIVVITDGPAGAYVYDGNEYWHGPMYPDPAPPVDRTGAGDSFSATFTTALVLGKGIEEALMWGPINSMSVVQHIGAQKGHVNKKQLLKYLDEAPKDYRPQKI